MKNQILVQLYDVEEAARFLGSYYQDRHAETFGLLGTSALNLNKIITQVVAALF